MSFPLYTALRTRIQAFAGMLALTPVTVTMDAAGTPLAAEGVLVTGNYFELLGVKPATGRLLTSDDDGPDGGSPVAVLTHGFWQRQFGSDPSILNRTIRLNKLPMTVVGVTEHGFAGTAAGQSLDFFAPVCMTGLLSRFPGFRFDSPDSYLYDVLARLAHGTDMVQAERAGDLVYQQLLAETGYFDPGAVLADPKGPFSRRPEEYHLRLSPGG